MSPSDPLRRVLDEAHELGFLGPGPLDGHVRVGRALARRAADHRPATIVDLGSGGGIPGLLLAEECPASQVILVERMTRRASFLRSAVLRIGLIKVEVRPVDVDDVEAGLADVVTARGFAPPAVTAEVAAHVLGEAGTLLVSDRGDLNRWDPTALRDLGYAPAATSTGMDGVTVSELERIGGPPDRRRRSSAMRKSPLF